MAVIIMLSNYTHDLATGLMFGSVVAPLFAAKVSSGLRISAVNASIWPWSTFGGVGLSTA